MHTFDLVMNVFRQAGPPVPLHRWILRGIQLAIFIAAGFFAFLLRFDFGVPPTYRLHLVTALAMWVLVKVPVFQLLGLDRGWWRYASVPDLLRLAAGNV